MSENMVFVYFYLLVNLNLLSGSVAKNKHFRPCMQNYALDRKMIVTF